MAQFDLSRVSNEVDAVFATIGLYKFEADAKSLVMDLLSQTGGQLMAFKQTYYNNDGTSADLVVIRGTMGTVFKGQSFNTPIDLWLPHEFPRARPMLFVVPFGDMKIPRHHKHVGSDGRVYHSYLSDWNQESTLPMLLMCVSSILGKMPPLVRVVPGQPVPELESIIGLGQQKPQSAPTRIRVTARPVGGTAQLSQPPYPPQPQQYGAQSQYHQYTPPPAPQGQSGAPPSYQAASGRQSYPTAQPHQSQGQGQGNYGAQPTYGNYPPHLDAAAFEARAAQDAKRAAEEAERKAEAARASRLAQERFEREQREQREREREAREKLEKQKRELEEQQRREIEEQARVERERQQKLEQEQRERRERQEREERERREQREKEERARREAQRQQSEAARARNMVCALLCDL